jgi:hypothetical protein
MRLFAVWSVISAFCLLPSSLAIAPVDDFRDRVTLHCAFVRNERTLKHLEENMRKVIFLAAVGMMATGIVSTEAQPFGPPPPMQPAFMGPGTPWAPNTMWQAPGIPPPLRRERVPRAPGPRFVWAPGSWAWNGRTWVWVPGAWVVPPRPKAVWVPGHWNRRGRGPGSRWVGGYWQ